MFLSDSRLALRSLLRSPAFTVLAVATLALGVGLTTTAFAVLDTVVLRPLPYANAERLVMVWHRYLTRDWGLVNLSYPTFADVSSQSQSFEHLAAFSFQQLTVEGASGAERLTGLRISNGLLSRLGTAPLRGRLLVPDDDRPGAPRTVVLSYELWQTRFGASADLPGGTVIFDGEPHVVVGIMPPGFHFPPTFNQGDVLTRRAARPEFWMPLTADNAPPQRQQRVLLSLATLKPGVTIRQAQAEVDVIARRLAQAFPSANADLGLTLIPLHEQVAGRARTGIVVLFGAVTFLVAIMCVNIGHLLLTRAAARRREVAIRVALGAGGRQIAGHLVAECVWISLAGAAAGLLAAWWGIELFTLLAAEQLPRLGEIGLHKEVVAFAIGLSAVCGLLVSLAPLAQTRSGNIMASLQAEGAGVTPNRRAQFTRRVLSAGQAALAILLLTGAGLMLQTLVRLTAVDPGFNSERLLTMQLFVAPTVARQVPERVAIHERLTQALSALPGVSGVGTVSIPPLSSRGDAAVTLAVEGVTRQANDEGPQASYRPVSVDYFRAMGIPLRQGRMFTALDGADAPAVIIVNETLAQRIWAGRDPIGRRLQRQNEDEWLTVVGVVGAVRQDGLASQPKAEIYRPYAQEPGRSFTVVLRTAREPESLVASARETIRRVNPAVPVSDVRAMETIIQESMGWPRMTAALLAIFAAIALLLAMLGVYGVVSNSVAQRTREFGVRMALGARRADLRRLILREELLPLAAGLAGGTIAARGLGWAMSGMLFEVSPSDLTTIAGAATLLLIAAVLACAIPARRAANVDPLAALRSR